MNYDSIKNQEIKRKLVDNMRPVLFSYPMQDLIEAQVFDYEDVWLEEYPEYYGDYVEFSGGSYDEWQEAVQEYTDMLDGFADDVEEGQGDEHYIALSNELAELENLETEPCEIYEYWIIGDPWYAKKLKAQGELIIEWHNLSIWGRQCTGQAILLDYVISRIAEDMQILEGQENEWLRGDK